MPVFAAKVVLKGQSGWLEGTIPVRVVWKCAGAMPGALYVMTSGMPLMPEWCANSWASPDTMLLPFHLPSLDKEVVQLFWMMYDVLGMRID